MTQGNEENITLGREGRIIVPKLVTETVATSPSDRTRKTVGVGEEVTLTLFPKGMSGVLWNMTGGGGQISGYTGDTITFTAPDRADDTTLTVDTDTGTVGSAMFHVIEPSEIFFENKSFFLPIYNPNGYVNSSNFVLSYLSNVYIKPDTVNFQKLCLFESAADVDPSTPGWRAFIPHFPRGVTTACHRIA